MLPLVSCLCVSKNHERLLSDAIHCFSYQTYGDKELILVYEDNHPSRAYIEGLTDLNIKKIMVPSGSLRLGGLRNLAIENASGEYIAQWDDDDLYHPQRIEFQMMRILDSQYDCCVLKKWMVYDEMKSQLYISGEYTWEGSIIVRKEIIRQVGYYDIPKGEDLAVTRTLIPGYKTLKIDKPELYIYNFHGNNTWHQQHFESNIFRQATDSGHFPNLRNDYETYFQSKWIEGLKELAAPEISIVMLIWNDLEIAKKTVDSILNVLDHHMFKEFIILDNNSEQPTRDYVKNLSHPKMRVILSDENKGVAGGRNILFQAATSDIIASLDSDVIVSDIAYFYKCIDVLHRNKDVAVCGTSGYVFNQWSFEHRFLYVDGEGYVDFISGCVQIFKRRCLEGISLDEAYSPFWLEDSDFCMQLKEKGFRLYEVPEFYGIYHDYPLCQDSCPVI